MVSGTQSTCRAVALQSNALGKQQPNVQENKNSEELRVPRDFPICEIHKTKLQSIQLPFPLIKMTLKFPENK